MKTAIVIVLMGINSFTVYKFIFNKIFIDFDDFNESLRYSFTPDIISLFKREYFKDYTAELKLSFFIGLCVMATVAEFWIINGIVEKIIGG